MYELRIDSQNKACMEQLSSSKYRSILLERKRKSDSEIPFKSYYNIIGIIMGFIRMHGGVIFSMNVNVSETYEGKLGRQCLIKGRTLVQKVVGTDSLSVASGAHRIFHGGRDLRGRRPRIVARSAEASGV